MVVIFLPATVLTGVTQERMATPSTCTVQEPHCATPQPYLVPVRPAFSRIAHNSGVSGSTSRLCAWPLIVSEIIAILPWGNWCALLPRRALGANLACECSNAKQHIFDRAGNKRWCVAQCACGDMD